jgi:hypothetical protein
MDFSRVINWLSAKYKIEVVGKSGNLHNGIGSLLFKLTRLDLGRSI